MKTSLVKRLLGRNVSRVQICGYAFASLAGLAIVLAAIQFYRDASRVFSSDTAVSRDYLVVSKQVGLTDRNVSFSPQEIADLEAQPWVTAVGPFTASRFKASIGVDFAGRGMSTETFFESIPERFFDTLPADWNFNPADGAEADVPIVLSRDYLALYNFGFASTRGLPKVREGEIGMIPLVVSIRGTNGERATLRGHIAGFSSRINTIAVPEEFMLWANERFAPSGGDTAPSRLVVEVNTPGDPAIARYLERNSMDIAGDKIDNGTAAYFLRLATGIVVAIGAVISVLAFFILMLSMFLLLQKNRDKLRQLMLLGYSPADVAKPYYALIFTVNIAVLVLACAATAAAQHCWSGALATLDATPSSLLPTFAIGTGIVLVVSSFNIISVTRRVRKDF